MPRPDISKPRGILNRKAGEGKFYHSRIPVSGDLEHLLEHFWIVKWSLEGEHTYVAETLPHPSVHIVIENEGARINGVMTGKFSRVLRSSGRAFGIKFRPAMFYPLLGAPVSTITDRSLTLGKVFGVDGGALEQAILKETDETRCAEIADAFFRKRLSERDSLLEQVRDLVERIAIDREIVRVGQLASLMGLSLRPLQRAFRKYVGVTPKWVIQRYRLHEAAEQLATGGQVDLTDLALRLGYFDQAHFARDFKKVVGRSPGEYARGS